MSDLGLLGGAGLGLFGSLASAGISSAVAMHNVDKTNDFNAQQSEINRDWQERMSNTSYQRAIDDLRSAGLNPMLAYMNGGATTPAGAQATGQDPSAVASALDVKDAFKQAGQQIQQEKQFDRQMDNTEKQTKSTVDLNSAQSSQLNASAENMRLTNRVRSVIEEKYLDYQKNHPGQLNPYEPMYFELANSSFEASMVNSAVSVGKTALKEGGKMLKKGGNMLKKGGKAIKNFFKKKKS